ncbi:cytochrome c peroxidase [Mesorhizobium atlanticum]|uniref:cytochrome c peroxidase n=1 Tax=Mesorhizobium atlanticum TaxID=2233532 RepID=UPI003CCAF17E
MDRQSAGCCGIAVQPVLKRTADLNGNPAASEKLELGKMLYFEPRLSQARKISCNPAVKSAALAPMAASPPSGIIVSTTVAMRRPCPTQAFNVAQFWDGRAADLSKQAGSRFLTLWRW